MGALSFLDPSSREFLGGGFGSGGAVGAANRGLKFVVTETLALFGIEIPTPDFQDRAISTNSPGSPRRVIYGKAKIGGQYAMVETSGTNQEDLNIIYIFASHPCDAVEQVYLNDKLVRDNSDLTTNIDPDFSGKLTTIASIDGLGNVPASISSAFPSFKESYQFKGLSYLFCQFKYDPELYRGIPNVSLVVRGKNDILDTRTDTTGYTANAALCELDWLRNFMSVKDAQTNEPIIEIDNPEWDLAADDCDTLVAGKDPEGGDITEPRFELNGTISLQGPKLESLVRMAQNGGVIPRYEQGVWGAVVQEFVAPIVDLNEDDLLSPIQVLTGANKQDKINTIKGSFISELNNFEQIEYPSLESPTALADDLELLERTIDYQFSSSPSQCRRLSKIALEKSRFGLSFNATFKIKTWEYPVGTRIRFSYDRFGWDNLIFRIVARDIDGINGVDLSLVQDAEEIYSWNEGDALAVVVPAPLNLPNPNLILVPESLTAIEELYIANTSKSVKARVEFTWVPGDVTAKNFEIEGSFNGADFRIFSDFIAGNTFAVDDLEIGSWIFRVRAVNGIGAKSDYRNLNKTIVGKTTPPQDVISFNGNIKPFVIELTWDAVPDLDIREYEIRLGTVWETAQSLQVISALAWDWEIRPTGTETLLIKAIDTTNNESLNAAVAVIDIRAPGSVEPLTAKVVDNNVELRWADGTTSFNVDRYEVRKGTDFETATVIGFVKSTFKTTFEVVAGEFKYWVQAIDVNGNKGVETSVNANVDQPPDFILQANQLVPLGGGTKVNLVNEIGDSVTFDTTTAFTWDSTAAFTFDAGQTAVLLGPANLTETWDEHFRSLPGFVQPKTLDSSTAFKWDSTTAFTFDHAYQSIQELQLDNGFDHYLQPTPATASFEETVDFLGVFTLSRIQLIPSVATIAGTPTIAYTVSYSEDDISYTDTAGLEATGVNFRYVKVKAEVSTSDNLGLVRINSLRLRLDVKLKTDAGRVITDGVTGLAMVPFNIAFVDIQSIQVSINSTNGDVATYDFVDVPNPTQFNVKSQTNSGAALGGAEISWNVRGV